jgi:hypothetical protein
MRVAASWRRLGVPERILLVVCLLHGLSPLVVVGVHHLFGFDETVYLSQINRFVPAEKFTAARARGTTLVAAPITLLTTSVVAIRLWLSAVTAVLMYVGFRPWLRLVAPWAVPLAAFLFSCLWTTIYYGFEAMPNIYVALGALPAVALVAVQLREPEVSRWRLGWLALASAFISLVRPTDALAVTVVLVGAALLARPVARRVRLAIVLASAGGFAIGTVEWVIESFVRFGGPVRRLALAQAQQGSSGLHFSLVQQARTLSGPILCRSGCDVRVSPAEVAWWVVAALLVAVGLWLSARAARPALWIASGAGLAVMAEYVFTIPYGAPRFMMPTYALLSLPAASGLLAVTGAARRLARPLGAALVAAALVLVGGWSAAQIYVLRHRLLPPLNATLNDDASLARLIRGDVGAARRCLLYARGVGVQVAYLDNCAAASDPNGLDTAADGGRVTSLYLSTSRRLPTALVGWVLQPLPPDRLTRHWYVGYDASTDPSAVASRW